MCSFFPACYFLLSLVSSDCTAGGRVASCVTTTVSFNPGTLYDPAPAEPVEPAEAAEPVETLEPVEPVEPAEPTELGAPVPEEEITGEAGPGTTLVDTKPTALR